MNTNQVLSDYLTYLIAQDKSHHTIANFTRDIRHFLESFESTELASVVPSDVDRFLVSVSTKTDGSPKHSNTLNRTKTALRSFFTWTHRNGMLTSNPAEHLHIKRVDRLPPVYLTDEEEKRLLDCLCNHPRKPHQQRDFTIIRLLLDTGIRVGELVQIDLSDIDGKHLIIRRQKGGSPIRKFLPSITRQTIADYIASKRSSYSAKRGSNALFLNQSGQRMHSRAIQLLTQKWVLLAGINKPITPHKLRHTFATSLYAKSRDILAVQKALGHRSVVNTQIYAHVSDESLEVSLENRSSD